MALVSKAFNWVELKKGEELVGFVIDESVDLIFRFLKKKDRIG